MIRWIAFDDDTAEAVVSRLRRGAAEIQHNSPVDAALQAAGPSVIVLPSSTPGKASDRAHHQSKSNEPAAEFRSAPHGSAGASEKAAGFGEEALVA